MAEYRRRIGLANRAEDCAEGLAAFRELAAAGLRAETKLYNSVLSLCALDGASRWDDAFEVYKAAEAAGCRPDEGTYTCLIRLCDVAGEAEKGYLLLQEMKAAGINPKRRTYSPLLRACAAVVGSSSRALELAEEAMLAEIELFEDDFANLLLACGGGGSGSGDVSPGRGPILGQPQFPAGQDVPQAAGLDSKVVPVPAEVLLRKVLPWMMEYCYMISAKTRTQLEALSLQYGAPAIVCKPDMHGNVTGGQLRSIQLCARLEQPSHLRPQICRH